MNRLLFLLHRYLGIALGLIVSVWCVSGIVMMYVAYPELTEADEVRVLPALDLAACCRLPDAAALGAGATDGVRVEMLAGRPVLRLGQGGGQRYWDLATGDQLGAVDDRRAREISLHHAAQVGVDRFRYDGAIERDQWTVYGAYDPHRPLFKFTGSDAAGTQWYVSSATGEIVQSTTASQRFWNWLGAVPHWLYPTMLRQHVFVWSQVVIWLTIFGTFLTVFGLYIGIRQYKSRRSGRYSPYRGISLWHHYCGLIFGVFTLTWLVSGFFSMNPWGALESRNFLLEDMRNRGGELTARPPLLSQLEMLPRRALPTGVVRLETGVVGGEGFVVGWHQLGAKQRLDPVNLKPAAMPENTLAEAAGRLRPGVPVADSGWLETADAYYYSHHETREFPVYRVVYADGERFYLDAVTAELLHAVDDNWRWYRWLHYGLHRGDFPLLRERPIWDAWMLPLLAGVTLGALTGTWMGFRRITRRRRRA
jgi:predicted DCC family thiol-disulfide oxidoreductase YuxK